MKILSEVVKNAPKSKVRELFDIAAGKKDVISLGIGQPDFHTPQSLIDGTIKALNDRKTSYPPTRGIPELLKMIGKKVKEENNIITDWQKSIIITNGGSQAITLAMAVIVNPNDEILLYSPNFLSYFYCSQFFYAKAVEIKRNDDFSPNFNTMKKSITTKTKVIVVNSPNNPTGYIFKRREWEELADFVIDNDLYLISDEVYEKYVYDDNVHFSPGSLNGMEDRTITLNGISKTYAATGFRLGYVIANDNIIDLMEKYHQYTAAGVNHPTQYGALAAMSFGSSYLDEILKKFVKRRDLVYNRLTEMGFDVSKPGGAFYIMPSIRHLGMTPNDFAMQLMTEKSVAVVPGDIFGSYSDDRIRISYAIELDKLNKALDRIEEFISRL